MGGLGCEAWVFVLEGLEIGIEEYEVRCQDRFGGWKIRCECGQIFVAMELLG